MEISIFDVMGPVMIGPSSSHTAGAARLSRVARLIAGESFDFVRFGLCGSFARTYRGHGTDRALVAGALGMAQDDEAIKNSFEIAKQMGIGFEFYETEIDGAHENTAVITFLSDKKAICEVVGASLGGGLISIRRIDGFETDLSAASPAIILTQHDRPGVIREVTSILADENINIGVMRLSRKAKGQLACTIIEVDSELSDKTISKLCAVKNVISARKINPL